MKSPWLFTQNSALRSACLHEQITLENDEGPTLSCRSCGKRWTFVPAGETPRYGREDDPTYPGRLDNRGWSKSARVTMIADEDSRAARVVELEIELANLRDLAFALYADIELSPELLEFKQRLIADRYAKRVAEAELLEVKQRLIAERYAKRVAEAEAAFAESWTIVQRAGIAIVCCRHCGFEAFPLSDATIEKHMQTCRPEVMPEVQRS